MSDENIDSKFHSIVSEIDFGDLSELVGGTTIILCDGTSLRFVGLEYDELMERLMRHGYAAFMDTEGVKVTVFAYAVSAVIGDAAHAE